jgi:hypothetical protein
LVGTTGATTGPHVHFEVRWGQNAFQNTYNPELWMAPPEGWGVLVGRIADGRGKPLQQLDVYVRNTESGRTHLVRTYGPGSVNADPYYGENLVLGDLLPGLYKVTFHYGDSDAQEWMYIKPGRVTYFEFRGKSGFRLDAPAASGLDSIPATAFP